MKYLLIILFMLTSCKVSKLEYCPDVTYLIVQSPYYNLYLPKTDIIKSFDKIQRSNDRNVNLDCIKKLNQTDSIKTNADFYLDGLEYLTDNHIDKMDRADVFYFCAIDLFKKHKILVYDKRQKKWILKYKTRHRVFKSFEYNAYYEVLYNDSIIYHHSDGV